MGGNTTEWSETDRAAAISVIRIKTFWLSQPLKTFWKTTVMNWLHDRITLSGANCTQMHHHCNNIMKTGIKNPFLLRKPPLHSKWAKIIWLLCHHPPPPICLTHRQNDLCTAVQVFSDQPSSTPSASRCKRLGERSEASLVPFYHQRAALVGCNRKGSWIQIRAV